MSPVRLAAPADAPIVARLLGEFRDWLGFAEPPDKSLRRDVERLLADPATDYLLAGADAGVCQLRYRYGVWLASEDCLLEDLFVCEEARGGGVGKALVAAALKRARERGCGRVELDVNELNPAARALYESLGFSALADPPGGNRLFMRRRL